MASSRAFDTEGVLESESVLNQLYKTASRDISPAQRIVKSLPLICELLAANIDLKGLSPQYFYDWLESNHTQFHFQQLCIQISETFKLLLQVHNLKCA